jgi:hypothetical protein
MKAIFEMGNVKVISNDPDVPVTVNVDGIKSSFEATPEEFIAYGKAVTDMVKEFTGVIKTQMQESGLTVRTEMRNRTGCCGSDKEGTE